MVGSEQISGQQIRDLVDAHDHQPPRTRVEIVLVHEINSAAPRSVPSHASKSLDGVWYPVSGAAHTRMSLVGRVDHFCSFASQNRDFARARTGECRWATPRRTSTSLLMGETGFVRSPAAGSDHHNLRFTQPDRQKILPWTGQGTSFDYFMSDRMEKSRDQDQGI